jgi:hypothetical protein
VRFFSGAAARAFPRASTKFRSEKKKSNENGPKKEKRQDVANGSGD